MKKYYIGLLAITLLSIGLVIVTVGAGLTEKNDKVTEKKVNEISRELEQYISSKKKLPENLDEAGIKNIPSTIKYEKLTSSTYKFCATFKKASKYGGTSLLTSLLWGGGIGNSEDEGSVELNSDYDNRERGSLYMYSHKAGENCQTVRPYSLSSSRGDSSIYDFSYPSLDTDNVSSNARDTERRTDIRNLHGQLESYYATNGYYPTLAEMNDKTFRTANLLGLDEETLKDPQGTSNTLSASPTKNIYSYAVRSNGGSSCENSAGTCATYTLSASLETGGTYSKNSLN